MREAGLFGPKYLFHMCYVIDRAEREMNVGMTILVFCGNFRDYIKLLKLFIL